MRQHFFVLFWIIGISQGYNAEAQVLVEDLNNRWLYYDHGQNQYLPVTHQALSEMVSVSFALSEQEFAGQELSLQLPKGSSVFLNQQIVAQAKETVSLVWEIDSLRKAIDSKALFFTVYRPKALETPLSTTVIAINSTIDLEKGLDEFLPVFRKENSQFLSFFIIASLMVLTLISILRRAYSKYFDDFYGFGNFIRNRVREDNFMRSGLLNPVSLTFYSVHSLLLGLLLLAFVQYYPEAPNSLTFLREGSGQLPWLAWLLSSILIFALILLKFVLISYFGKLFALRSNQTGHFSDYMQMSLLFFLVVFILVFVAFKWLVGSPLAVSWLLICVLLFSFFRVVVLFFKLMKQTNFRNLHLISYLCATELIPLLICIKLFL